MCLKLNQILTVFKNSDTTTALCWFGVKIEVRIGFRLGVSWMVTLRVAGQCILSMKVLIKIKIRGCVCFRLYVGFNWTLSGRKTQTGSVVAFKIDAIAWKTASLVHVSTAVFVVFQPPSARRLTILVYTPASPTAHVGLYWWCWGSVEVWRRVIHHALRGGLPGMLLNNEVHSLTSPSKAKFPCCPFQTRAATLTRVTPPTAKKNPTSSCFAVWQAQWLLLRGMKNKQVHFQSLMHGYSYNYHRENDLLCLLCHGEAVSS